jgi:hypothetical protein
MKISSVELRLDLKMLNSLIDEFLSNFDPGTHVILFYDTQESKRKLLFTHLKYGEKSQGLAYVCSEESPSQIRKEMSEFGLDTTTVQGMNKLTIANYDDVYIVDGEVDVQTIISRFARMVDNYKGQGLSGLRAAAEMSCFFKHEKVDDLIAYERALHKRLAFRAEGICAYNISELSTRGYLDLVIPLVRAHDPVIFASPGGYLIMKPSKFGRRQVEEMAGQATAE